MDLREQMTVILFNESIKGEKMNLDDLASYLVTELSLVQLDENQDIPQNPYGEFPFSFRGWGYADAVNTMLNNGFRKVKLPRGEER